MDQKFGPIRHTYYFMEIRKLLILFVVLPKYTQNHYEMIKSVENCRKIRDAFINDFLAQYCCLLSPKAPLLSRTV